MKKTNFNTIIYKTALSTFISLLIIAVLLTSVLTFISPVSLARLTSSLGLDQVSVFYYELSYNKSGDINDLYNLLNKSITINSEEKIIENFELLYDDGNENYFNFINYINNFNLSNVTNLSLRLYLVNEDARLKSRYVKAVVRENTFEKAVNFALEDLMDQNVTGINSKVNFIFDGIFNELISIDATNDVYIKLEDYNYNDEAFNIIQMCYDYYNNLKIVYNSAYNLEASSDDRFKMAVFADNLIKINSILMSLSGKASTSLNYDFLQADRNTFFAQLQQLLA